MPARRLPDFDLEVTGGRRLAAADLRGRRTVLYFYPKDDTPGCTLEGREFTALRDAFERAGVTVYGVSPDSARSHDKFAAKCDLGIPLISDPGRLLCEALDVWKEKSMYGRTYMGVERSTFLVGPELTIDREWRKVKPAGHAQEVLDAVAGG
jgi:peroxiredoxin Q/BCP